MTSHLVDLQICFEDDLMASENNVSPAARSTASTVSCFSIRLDIRKLYRLTRYNEAFKGCFIRNGCIGQHESAG